MRPVRVLVAAASRHAATAEIASRIGATLTEQLAARGVAADVHVRHAEGVRGIDGYDAVVLGSAVYAGRWLRPARALARTHTARLATVPVWLFSSGPVGDPLAPLGEPAEVADLVRLTGAREHRVFAGLLDRRRLGPAERLMVRAVRAADGDHRDWTAVAAWATGIADALCLLPRIASDPVSLVP
jgi:menaquinone-dependent protoporphyrinogen oxidase